MSLEHMLRDEEELLKLFLQEAEREGEFEMKYPYDFATDCYVVDLDLTRLFLIMNEQDWLYCRTNMYEEKPPCFQLERYRENMWNYLGVVS